MPSPWHDSVKRLVEEQPDFAVRVVRDLMGEPLPHRLAARLAPSNFNDRPSIDFDCDTVVVAGPHHDPVRGIIVEAQQAKLEDKRRKMAKYAAELWVLLGCPVDVVVICPDEATADYYAVPVVTTLPGYVFTARPLYPSRIPVITDPEDMAADPARATLVVGYHGAEPGVALAFAEGMALLGEAGYAYTDIGYSLSPLQVQRLLEEIMSTGTIPLNTPWAKKAYAEGSEKGLADGVAKGEAKAVLTILETRRLDVTTADRDRISSCTDLAQLQDWVRRAVTAKTTSDLFEPEWQDGKQTV
jgi:hypothetical protein